MSELGDLASKVGKDILEETKQLLGAEWDTLQENHREDLERAAQRLGKLVFEQMRGDDVEQELAIVRATIKNWQTVGTIAAANSLEKAFWEGVEKVGQVLGTFLVAAARTSLGV